MRRRLPITKSKTKETGVDIPFLLWGVVLVTCASHQAGKATREYLDQYRIVSATSDTARGLDPEGVTSIWTVLQEEIDAVITPEEEGVNVGNCTNLPLFRHLFLDLDGIDPQWIQSRGVLQELMKEVAKEYDSRLFVHGCHEDTNGSIVCLGIFNDRGHMAIHAWPNHGVVLLDLLVIDSKLIDYLQPFCDIFHAEMPMLFDPFLINEDPTELPTWYIRPRVCHVRDSSDYQEEIGAHSAVKFQVSSIKTRYQQVDVVDVQTMRDRIDLKEYQENDPDYIRSHPDLFRPDRLFFLDGVVQSTLCGDAPYHEALVHPSMFAHPNPRRVAIIGGGECATLREVLKHNTVEKAVMIEIDPGVIEASKVHLPSWNDCSNYEGRSGYCVHDSRAEIHNEDALKWFIDRYLATDDKNQKEPLFDVIIMDALDPQDVVDFAKALYGDSAFVGALYAALANNGILITQVGDAPGPGDPPEHRALDGNRILYKTSLARAGFKKIVDYCEDHAGFEEPWYFYAAFKELSSRDQWMATEAEIKLKMRKRSFSTIDGSSPFKYFDGATMKAYQYRSQASVDVFCFRELTPRWCGDHAHGFYPSVKNFPLLAQDGRVGVFAKVDILGNSFLTLEQTGKPINIEPSPGKLIERMRYHAIGEDCNHGDVHAFAYNQTPPSAWARPTPSK